MNQKLIYSHAYSGHGLAMSVMAGKLISEKILDKSNRFDIFNQIKHLKIPGGNILRRPNYSAAILYYRFRDYLSSIN